MATKAIFNDLGPAQISWNGKVLNPVLGTVTMKSELQNADIQEAGQGNIPVDSVDTGRLVTVEVPITRAQLDTLVIAIPGSLKDAVNSALLVPNKVGNSYFSSAQELIIKPLEDNVATSDTTKWTHFFKTYPFEKMELGYDNEGQRVILVEFKVYPDDTAGNVGSLYRFGPATPRK